MLSMARLIVLIPAIFLMSALPRTGVGADFLFSPLGCEFSVKFPEKPVITSKEYRDRSGNHVDLSRAEMRFNAARLQSTCETYRSVAPFASLRDADTEKLIRNLAKQMNLQGFTLIRGNIHGDTAYDVEYRLKARKSSKSDFVGKAVWVFGERSRLITEVVVPVQFTADSAIGEEVLRAFLGSIRRSSNHEN